MSGPEDSASPAVDPTLRYFSRCFERLGVEWCVAGAVAANAYRAPRATTDLDLIVLVHAAQVGGLVQVLQKDGWRVFRRSPESEYPDIIRLGHDTHFPTDLLVVKIPYQREALARAKPTGPEPGALRILSVEDVIIHKLIAYRYRDRADIMEILRNNPTLDLAYVEQWCEFWAIQDRWREAVAESGWIRNAG